MISEAPSDEVYARLIMSIAATGSVRTETLKAFTEDEYRKLIASLP